MDCSMPGFPVHHQLPELAQTQVHQVNNAIQPSHALSTLSSAFNLAQHQGLFQRVSSSHQVAKILELQHQSFQWVSRVDFPQDWLVWSCCPRDRSLLQHHSSKAWVLWRSAFFAVQLSQPHMTTGKTTALTVWIFVGRLMSLLFNTLSRFVIAFLPSNHLLISWLQSPSTVILESKKRKSVTMSIFPPYTCHEVMGLDAMIFSFF